MDEQRQSPVGANAEDAVPAQDLPHRSGEAEGEARGDIMGDSRGDAAGQSGVGGTAGGGYGVGSGSGSSGGSSGGGDNASAGPATDFVRAAPGPAEETDPDEEQARENAGGVAP